MDFPFSYHYKVEDDLRDLPENIQKRVLKAVEERLSRAPQRYGDPLRESLSGLWKLRIGDYRVVYEVTDDREVIVWGVIHREEVYEIVKKRWND